MPEKAKPDFRKIALAAIDRGLAVVPLDGKAPFMRDWESLASRDPKQIEDWAKKWPRANCGAVVAGQNYWIADVDDVDWFLENCPASLPETLVVKTGSGKYHIYFKGPRPAWAKPVKNPAYKSREETPNEKPCFIEFPGQCVAPGSLHPDTGREYSVAKDLPIAEIPKEWRDFLSRAGERGSLVAKRGLNPLRKECDIEGALRGAGLKFDRLEQDGKVFFNYHEKMGGCLVKGSAHDPANARQSAFVWRPSNGHFWHQCFSAQCQVPGKTKAALEKIGLRLDDLVVPAWRALFRSKAELNQEPVPFVVENFIPAEGITGIGSPSGHGKTWALLSASKAIRKGGGCKLWGLLNVPRSYEVLYMTTEGGDRAINHRLNVLGMGDDEGFLLRTATMGRRLELDRPELLAAAKGRVVMLDTLVRWLGGRDENSSGEMAQLFELMGDLLSAGAVAVVFAHHSVKGSAKNPWAMTPECVFRGSGDIIAALSAGHGVFQLDCKERNKTLLHVECVKPRDFEPMRPFQIQAIPHFKERQDFAVVKAPGDCDYFKQELAAHIKGGGGGDGMLAEILAAKAAGKTHKQIADELRVSTKTVQRKLDASGKRKEDEEAEENPQDEDLGF